MAATETTKVCRACGKELPLEAFYLHLQMKDGRLNFCVACVRERAKTHRTRNLERIREYDRKRGYRGTHTVVYNKVRSIRSEKPSACPECGSTDASIEAHHPDYSQPTVVEWMCLPCHRALHRTYRYAG